MIRPLNQVVQEAVLEALVESDYNVGRAAGSLGVSYRSVYRWLAEWGVPRPQQGTYPEVRRRVASILQSLKGVTGSDGNLP